MLSFRRNTVFRICIDVVSSVLSFHYASISFFRPLKLHSHILTGLACSALASTESCLCAVDEESDESQDDKEDDDDQEDDEVALHFRGCVGDPVVRAVHSSNNRALELMCYGSLASRAGGVWLGCSDRVLILYFRALN